MNLKVIHLFRKVERIDRDLEEIQTLLNTLQMDREYSQSLKDFLIDEYHRLKNLKKEIFRQAVKLPDNFLNVVKLFPENENQKEILNPIEIEVKIQKNKKGQESNKTPTSENFIHLQKKDSMENHKEQNHHKEQKDQIKKSFLFRFE